MYSNVYCVYKVFLMHAYQKEPCFLATDSR